MEEKRGGGGFKRAQWQRGGWPTSQPCWGCNCCSSSVCPCVCMSRCVCVCPNVCLFVHKVNNNLLKINVTLWKYVPLNSDYSMLTCDLDLLRLESWNIHCNTQAVCSYRTPLSLMNYLCWIQRALVWSITSDEATDFGGLGAPLVSRATRKFSKKSTKMWDNSPDRYCHIAADILGI